MLHTLEYGSAPKFVRPARLPLLFLGALWLMISGSVVVREQEPATSGEESQTTMREQDRNPARDVAMKVAVGNSMLDQGKGKSALSLYKEAIAEGNTQSSQATALLGGKTGGKEWGNQELLFGNFDKEERKAVIRDLLQQGNTELDLGDYDRAVELFEKVFLLDPLNHKASHGIDVARERLIEDKKIQNETFLSEQDAENVQMLHMELARASDALKEGSRARASMYAKRALLLDPDNAEAKRLLRDLGEPL